MRKPIKKTLEDPTVRGVLTLLGVGVILVATVLIPTAPMTVKPFIDFYKKRQRENDLKEWNRFNKSRLRQILNRLQQQRVVEISKEDGMTCIKLTDRGKVKFLKYKLEEMMIDKPPRWDGKWRLLIYDIKKDKRFISEIFRQMLRRLEFLKLQKSVYLTPYPCKDQIEFLRQYYGLNMEVIYLEVSFIENEQVYKNYFAL